jgi:hypothetical protein
MARFDLFFYESTKGGTVKELVPMVIKKLELRQKAAEKAGWVAPDRFALFVMPGVLADPSGAPKLFFLVHFSVFHFCFKVVFLVFTHSQQALQDFLSRILHTT